MSEISDEMVEKAARALNPAAWRDDVPEQWRERQPLLRDSARKSARAALEAVLPMVVERERERIDELEKALSDAIEDIQDWGAYASEYFQTKHDLSGEIARLAAIRARKQKPPHE